jgi:hypothetical protein
MAEKNTHELKGFLRISLNEDGSLDGWSALKIVCHGGQEMEE